MNIPDEKAQALEDAAQRLGVSIEELLRATIDEELERRSLGDGSVFLFRAVPGRHYVVYYDSIVRWRKRLMAGAQLTVVHETGETPFATPGTPMPPPVSQ